MRRICRGDSVSGDWAMIDMLLPIALLMFFVAAVLFLYNIAPIGDTVAARGLVVHRDRSQLPIYLKLPYPVLDLLAPVMRFIKWRSYREKTTVLLQRAGIAEVVTVDHLLAMKVLSAIIVPIITSQVFVVFQNPALFAIAAFGGFIIPDQLVNDLRKKREKALVRALPGSVDVLSLSVEAGPGFLVGGRRR